MKSRICSALRLEAIASKLEAIARRLEAIASRLKAIALGLEAIALKRTPSREKSHQMIDSSQLIDSTPLLLRLHGLRQALQVYRDI